MKRNIKILWNNICNFIEFSFFISAVIRISFYINNKLITRLSILLNFNTDLVPEIMVFLALVFIIFVAFKKKYVVFTKKYHFQNILSIIFLVLALLWFNKSYEIDVVLSMIMLSSYF